MFHLSGRLSEHNFLLLKQGMLSSFYFKILQELAIFLQQHRIGYLFRALNFGHFSLDADYRVEVAFIVF